VTHDEDLAARCQHIIYIKDGSIQNAHGAKSQAKPTGKTKTT
jgi:ABC-type lipoprotein export system ATPase subunit